jgi:hypothetical protein
MNGCTEAPKPPAPIIFAEAVVDARKAGAPGRAHVKVVRAFVGDELGGRVARLV